jgi:hypothetical protein
VISFFGGELPPFWQNVMEKENAVTNSLIFVQKLQKMNKIAENRHDCYYMKGCLRLFYFNIFEYRQIWLNILMDDRHLSNITKLKKEKHWNFRGSDFRRSDSCYQQVGQTDIIRSAHGNNRNLVK